MIQAVRYQMDDIYSCIMCCCSWCPRDVLCCIMLRVVVFFFVWVRYLVVYKYGPRIDGAQKDRLILLYYCTVVVSQWVCFLWLD